MNFTGNTLESALANAAAISLSIVDPAAEPEAPAKVRFFSSELAPSENTTAAEFEEAEIVATGYPAGGYPVAELYGPDRAPGGGVTLTIPSFQVDFTAGFPVTIAGWWLEDSTGVVRRYGTFATPRVMTDANDGWPFIAQWVEGQNQLVSLVGV